MIGMASPTDKTNTVTNYFEAHEGPQRFSQVVSDLEGSGEDASELKIAIWQLLADGVLKFTSETLLQLRDKGK